MTATLPASPELTDAEKQAAAKDISLFDALQVGEGWTNEQAIEELAWFKRHWLATEIERHRSSPSSAWRDIKDAPKEPVGIDPQIDWNIGEHGPYILIAFDREHYPEWGASVGWWAPKWNCWRWLEDDGPNDVQPTYFQPLREPPK